MSWDDYTAKQLLDRVVEVSDAVGLQAGVGGADLAGFIISCLYANPELFTRFMEEGAELILDGSLDPENGALSWSASGNRVVSPHEMRRAKGMQH
jgi:hypothetical protein